MQVNQLIPCLAYLAEQMIASEAKLTALDQQTGDGDHGIGIKRGFSALLTLIHSGEFAPPDIAECLKQAGTRLMTSMGGASGAIFGTLFRSAGTSLAGKTEFNTLALSGWLNQGADAIHQRGGASLGDKTMLDALIPAAQCARAEAEQQTSLSLALAHCAAAAMQGAENTKALQAKFGRAKNLAERAIGYCDPGAVSMALILQFISEFVQRHNKDN